MKKNKIIKSFVLIFVAFALISLVYAAEANYCCERTTSGAWCQNSPKNSCDSGYKMAPTSCDSTSYCKAGCCFDSLEGLCMENTPQRVCEASKGTWANDSKCEIAQCNLGCCVLADQGALVTLTRCKQLSGFFGLETDFRKNINDELNCIAAAQQEDFGACVFEDTQSASKTCKFVSRKNCPTASYSNQLNSTENKTASVGFYKDILCTAEELGTECAPTTKTMMLEGKDGIYWKDTCGNPANIYDASKVEDKNYWKKVYKKEESCGASSSNAKNSQCGNCDYYLGSIGKEATSGTGYPKYGDYICIDLNCKTAGKKHGESWCVTDSPTGNGADTVGSRYYKEVCIYGEVLTEACEDYRNQICIQGQFGTFTEAACKVNRWRDCTGQQEKDDCENYDARDCHWIDGYYFSSSTNQIEKSRNDSNPTVQGLCLPNYPPGFNFWGSSSVSSSASSNNLFPATGNTLQSRASSTQETSNQCSLGNAQVTLKWVREEHPAMIKYLFKEEDRKGEWKCNNTECSTYIPNPADQAEAAMTVEEGKAIAFDMNNFCRQLGDCGQYINWVGEETTEGFAAYLDNRRIAGTGSSEVISSTSSSTGNTNTGTGSEARNSPGHTIEGASNVLNSLGNMPGSNIILPIAKVTGNFVRDLIKNIEGEKK